MSQIVAIWIPYYGNIDVKTKHCLFCFCVTPFCTQTISLTLISDTTLDFGSSWSLVGCSMRHYLSHFGLSCKRSRSSYSPINWWRQSSNDRSSKKSIECYCKNIFSPKYVYCYMYEYLSCILKIMDYDYDDNLWLQNMYVHHHELHVINNYLW